MLSLSASAGGYWKQTPWQHLCVPEYMCPRVLATTARISSPIPSLCPTSHHPVPSHQHRALIPSHPISILLSYHPIPLASCSHPIPSHPIMYDSIPSHRITIRMGVNTTPFDLMGTVKHFGTWRRFWRVSFSALFCPLCRLCPPPCRHRRTPTFRHRARQLRLPVYPRQSRAARLEYSVGHGIDLYHARWQALMTAGSDDKRRVTRTDGRGRKTDGYGKAPARAADRYGGDVCWWRKCRYSSLPRSWW